VILGMQFLNWQYCKRMVALVKNSHVTKKNNTII